MSKETELIKQKLQSLADWFDTQGSTTFAAEVRAALLYIKTLERKQKK